MANYTLLRMHMAQNGEHMFGHAVIAGLLAKDNSLNSYAKYKNACAENKVMAYSEIAYNQFMVECHRPISQPSKSSL